MVTALSVPPPDMAGSEGKAPVWCDWAAISRKRLHDYPYKWGLIDEVFPDRRVLDSLESEFPGVGFRLTERPSAKLGAKGYRSHNLPLVQAGVPVPDKVRQLTPLWTAFVSELRSPAYRRAVAALTGRRLDRCTLEIRAVRYGPGSWIDPHTDRTDKVVTQIWYFNSSWPPRRAGVLRILRSASAHDVAAEVRPRLGASVVLVPSDRSWHAVTPVADDSPEDRRTLLVHFVAGEAK